MTELKSNLTTITEPSEFFQNSKIFIEKIFFVFKEINLREVKEFREVDGALNRSVESSSKAFDMPFKNLKAEYKNSMRNSFRAILQVFHHLGLFDSFHIKDENFYGLFYFLTKDEEEN